MTLGHRIFGHTDSARSQNSADSISETIKYFLISREVEGCSPLTVGSYAHRLDLFRRFLSREGIECVQDVRRVHVEKYLLDAKARGLSPHYIASFYRTNKVFFNFCMLEKVIEQHPMQNIKYRKTPQRAKPFISIEERDKLLAVNPITTYLGARNTAIIWTFWTTGARLNEVSRLKKIDLNWDKGGTIKVFGKGSRERLVLFEPEAQKAIMRYLRMREDDLPELWLTEERHPMDRMGVASMLKKSGQRAGIKVVDACHIFRRTWAWERIKEGVNLKYVMLVGGWATMDVLLQYVKAIEVNEALEQIRAAHKTQKQKIR